MRGERSGAWNLWTRCDYSRWLISLSEALGSTFSHVRFDCWFESTLRARDRRNRFRRPSARSAHPTSSTACLISANCVSERSQRGPQVFCSDGRSNRRGGACRRCSTDTVSGPVCPAAALATASATARSPDAGLGRRGMAHEEGAILDFGRSHDLEIILDAEISDLAQADDGQRGGLHAADTDDAGHHQSARCGTGAQVSQPCSWILRRAPGSPLRDGTPKGCNSCGGGHQARTATRMPLVMSRSALGRARTIVWWVDRSQSDRPKFSRPVQQKSSRAANRTMAE